VELALALALALALVLAVDEGELDDGNAVAVAAAGVVPSVVVVVVVATPVVDAVTATDVRVRVDFAGVTADDCAAEDVAAAAEKVTAPPVAVIKADSTAGSVWSVEYDVPVSDPLVAE
jgi:hypothetical protein